MYTWECRGCEEVNTSERTECMRCGFGRGKCARGGKGEKSISATVGTVGVASAEKGPDGKRELTQSSLLSTFVGLKGEKGEKSISDTVDAEFC